MYEYWETTVMPMPGSSAPAPGLTCVLDALLEQQSRLRQWSRGNKRSERTGGRPALMDGDDGTCTTVVAEVW